MACVISSTPSCLCHSLGLVRDAVNQLLSGLKKSTVCKQVCCLMPPYSVHGLHMTGQVLDSLSVPGLSNDLFQPGAECNILWYAINVVRLLCTDLIGI